VVGVLPKVVGQTDNFFNMQSCFSKMKKTAVFMNIGRGTTVNEDDLATALKDGTIAGAVCDVFKVEPLPKESPLWECDNMLITPHCADQDYGHLHRAMQTFATNLTNFAEGGADKLTNICDKQAGY